MLPIALMLCAAPELIRLPPAERIILNQVADEYGLQGDARKLLFVIRVVENGGAGRELGVLHPQAQRFKGDYARSLRLQGCWAAGTIRKRWTGDIDAFGKRWCPPNAHALNHNWIPNVKALMGNNQ